MIRITLLLVLIFILLSATTVFADAYLPIVTTSDNEQRIDYQPRITIDSGKWTIAVCANGEIPTVVQHVRTVVIFCEEQ